MQVRSDKLDLTKAKFSPSRYFDTPWQVVAHEQLTHGDKIEILTQWEFFGQHFATNTRGRARTSWGLTNAQESATEAARAVS